MTTLTLSQTLVTIDCAHCGLLFAVPKDWEQRRRSDHATFWCPAGHGQSFTGKTDTEKATERAAAAEREARALRERLQATQATLVHTRDQREAAERSAAAHKGHATRLRKRAAHGVCACCGRTFPDMARHMADKHPEFVAETATP